MQLISNLRYQAVQKLGFIFQLVKSVCCLFGRTPSFLVSLCCSIYVPVFGCRAHASRATQTNAEIWISQKSLKSYVLLRTFHSAKKRLFHPSASTQTVARSHTSDVPELRTGTCISPSLCQLPGSKHWSQWDEQQKKEPPGNPGLEQVGRAQLQARSWPQGDVCVWLVAYWQQSM